VVAAVLVPLAFFWPLAWWLLLGSMLHFSLDVWEYGLRLNPFQRKAYGLKLLRGIENDPFRVYLRRYFSDPRFLGGEIAFAALAAILLLLR